MTDREKFEAWWQVEFHNGNPPRRGWDYYWHGEDYADEELSGLWKAWQAALASQQPANDGWIEWAGGECPVAFDDVVDVMLRNKALSFMRYAGNLRWEFDGDASDIIAYRVVKP